MFRASAPEQFVHRDGLDGTTIAELVPNDLLEVGETAFGHEPERLRQVEHVRIREPVVHEHPIPAALDQRGLPQHLQMLGGARDRQTHFGGERVDGALGLREQLQHFEPMWAGERFPETGELAVQALLELAMGVSHD
jgi:hypothetical protein